MFGFNWKKIARSIGNFKDKAVKTLGSFKDKFISSMG